MKVCILGDNLTSLALAKALVKKEIFVDLFYEKKNTKIDITRTIGISKSNIDFFNREITNIKRMLWPIKKIKIFTENSNDKEIIKFENQKDNLFSILQNQKIFNQLIIELKKSKFFKPMVAVPSTYSAIKESTLIKYGFKIVIYANHLLRASYPAMMEVAKKILLNQRSKEIEKKIISVKEILTLIK